MSAQLFLDCVQQRIAITDASCVGETRRQAEQLAANHGFGPTDVGRVQLVASELASNVFKHGGGGEVLLQALGSGTRVVIELLALDHGPGMADVDACLRDGHSTTGTAGTGLGAMSRLAEGFDLYSQPGDGTVVRACLHAHTGGTAAPPEADPPALCFGAISVAKAGQDVCGDAWGVALARDRAAVVVADGLGHGTAAATAARRALDVFGQQPFAAPAETLRGQHEALRGTRGAAAACALLDPVAGRIEYGGIGNIAASCADDDQARGLASINGTLGFTVQRIQQFSYAWPEQTCLVMHSDGLSKRWSLRAYPGLLHHHPGVIAALLYRDQRRGQDDATVVVAKRAP